MCCIAGVISATPLSPLHQIARSMSFGSSHDGPMSTLVYSALVLEYWCAAHLGHLPASESVQQC